MNLPKAIEILKQHVEWCDPIKEADTFRALKLGVEAIDAIDQFRKGSDTRHLWKLPSETED